LPRRRPRAPHRNRGRDDDDEEEEEEGRAGAVASGDGGDLKGTPKTDYGWVDLLHGGESGDDAAGVVSLLLLYCRRACAGVLRGAYEAQVIEKELRTKSQIPYGQLDSDTRACVCL
jgi:hypothetical protein